MQKFIQQNLRILSGPEDTTGVELVEFVVDPDFAIIRQVGDAS